MIVIPKEKPVIENLHSYYLDIERLCEHYQGEIGSGGIHFRSPTSEGLIFFDKDEFLNGYFKGTEEEISGQAAVRKLVGNATDSNYLVSVYRIDPEKVYFWANVPEAQKIYKDLSTEFTDLEGLIRKMTAEKLTGYIDVAIGNGGEGGIIFLNSGVIMGGSYSWGDSEPDSNAESQALLIRKTKEAGGVFHVSSIALPTGNGNRPKHPEVPKTANLMEMLSVYMAHFEQIITSQKRLKGNFNALVKKKFVEKAEKYPFLDPFAAEFEYRNHQIRFDSNASEADLARGLFESIGELAVELGVVTKFKDTLVSWEAEHAELLAANQLTL